MHDSILNISVCLKFAPIMFNLWNKKKYKKKQKNIKKKPFWKKPLLITKKTVTQDPNDPLVQWVELELYNPYKDKKDNTIH